MQIYLVKKIRKTRGAQENGVRKRAENIISKPKTRTPVRLGHVAHAALA